MSLLNIEVAYAREKGYRCIALQVTQGTTIEIAIVQSGILMHFPEIDLHKDFQVGIYNKIKALNTVVQEGDRVEIYRPLHQDAMAARVERAKAQKQNKTKN